MKIRLKDQLLFLGPLFVLPGLLVAWPLLDLVLLSFKQQVVLFQIDSWIGLDNYAYLLGKDARFWQAVANTFYFTGISVALELIIGLGFALYLRFGKASIWIKMVLLLPWAIPNVVSGRLWQWMLHPDVGVINYILQALGWTRNPIQWLADPDLAMNAAILADVWKTTPFMTLLLFAGLQRIPQSLIQAGQVDRTPPGRFLFHILLPQMKGALLTALVLRILDAFRVFDVIYVMTGGGPANSTESLSIYAYRAYFQSLQFGYGSSIALIQLLLMTAITFLLIRGLESKWKRS